MAQRNKTIDELTWWEKHSDAVIVGILVSGIAGIGGLLWTINASLSDHAARLNIAEQRMERIASTLPDLQIRLSEEERHRDYNVALVQPDSSESIIKNGKKDKVYLINMSASAIQVLIPPKSIDERISEAFRFAASGSFSATMKESRTFSDIEQSQISAGAVVTYVPWINPNISHVAQGNPEKITKALLDMGWEIQENRKFSDIEYIVNENKTAFENIVEISKKAEEIIEK